MAHATGTLEPELPNQKWRHNDVRNFRRDFRRAAHLLLVPPYGDSAELTFVETKHTLP